MSTVTIKQATTAGAVKAGIASGLVGGMVFGMMMGMMGMLPMVGMMVGMESAAVGFIVHMIISATIGAVYGVVATRLPAGWLTAVIAGMVNGVIWWVLGALIMMPIILGMSEMVFKVGAMQWQSLMGHLIFGVITAIVFVPLSKKL